MSYSPVLLLHVTSGSVGLLSGAVALSFRKGSRPHGIAGTVFLVSMLTASAAGAFLGFRKSEMDNFFGGVLTFYLVATAWLTARRKDGEIGFFDRLAFLVGIVIAVLAVTYWMEAAFSKTGTKAGIPASSYVLPAVVALIAVAGDARMLLRGGLHGVQKIARHLWRMCFALFVASASIFLARPQLFPAFMSRTHVLLGLGILPLILMVFWLARVLFTNAFRKGSQSYRTHTGGYKTLRLGG
jgi:uncharacterized membrane protein